MAVITIQPLTPVHYEEWLSLFEGYADHYQFTLSANSIATTWGWLMNGSHPTMGLVAVLDDSLVGFAHCRAMPSPLRGQEIGFLDDLFVDPECRGMGVAEKLIAAVKEEGQDQGWPVIRWITRDNNYRAKALYDQLSSKTNWDLYEMSCDL